MKTTLVNFHGTMIPCIKENNVIWVAIKSICDAIGLDHKNQLETIADDEILKDERKNQSVQVGNQSEKDIPAPSEQRVQVGETDNENEAAPSENSNNQGRIMACLPLEFIHGWLFQVKITNTMKDQTKKNLIKYKRECYRVLFVHFYGSMKKQIEANEMEIELLKNLNDINTQKKDLNEETKKIQSQLDKIRKERLEQELDLFD